MDTHTDQTRRLAAIMFTDIVGYSALMGQSEDKAFALLPDKDRYTQRTGLIMAKIYMATLNIIEADSCQVMEKRVSLSPIRKLWLSWKTARQEKNRFNRYRRHK